MYEAKFPLVVSDRNKNKNFVKQSVRVFIAILLGCIAIFAGEYGKKEIEFHNISVKIDDRLPIKINALPYLDLGTMRKFGKTGRIYTYKLHLNGYNWSTWRITADDRVTTMKINGNSVDLSGINEESRRDWHNGFTINLSRYFTGVQNTVEIEVENFGGPAALKINSMGFGHFGILSGILGGVGFLLLCSPLLLLLEERRLRYILAFGILLIAIYNAYTNYNVRGHDVEAHIEYIQYLIDHSMPPPPFGGWEFHQPPLYYIVAAPLFYFTKHTLNLNPGEILQYLSGLFSVIFLIYSIKCFGITFGKDSKKQLWASILLCGWTSFVIHSVRVGNDPLYYMLCSAAFYHILRWWKYNKTRNLLYAAIFISCLVMTKANGLILIAAAGILFIIQLFDNRLTNSVSHRLINGCWAALIICIGLTVSFGDGVYYQLKGGMEDSLLGDSIKALHQGLFVGNEPRNYLIFDIQTFLTEPYAYPWEDKGGRQYFWNYLLKTSLFGDHIYLGDYRENTAIVLSTVYLLLFCGICIAIYKLRGARAYLPHLLFIAFSILAILTFRIRAPASPHGDFRFILPALIPAITFYVGYMNERSSLIKIYFTKTIITLFVLIGVLFHLLPE